MHRVAPCTLKIICPDRPGHVEATRFTCRLPSCVVHVKDPAFHYLLCVVFHLGQTRSDRLAGWMYTMISIFTAVSKVTRVCLVRGPGGLIPGFRYKRAYPLWLQDLARWPSGDKQRLKLFWKSSFPAISLFWLFPLSCLFDLTCLLHRFPVSFSLFVSLPQCLSLFLFIYLFLRQPRLPSAFFFPVNTSLRTSNYSQVVTQWFHSEQCHSARASNSHSNYILGCCRQSCLSAKCLFSNICGATA